MSNSLSFLEALFYFTLVFILTAIITAWVFLEIENLTTYLKKLSEENEDEVPKLRLSIFGTKQLSLAFHSLKKMWSNQLLSESWILQNLPVPVCILDNNQKVVFANQSMLTTFKSVLISQSLPQQFYTSKTKKALQSIYQNTSIVKKCTLAFKNGKTYQIRIEHLPTETKLKGQVVLVFQDITSFESINQKQLEFIAHVSHELKTPLSIIAGFTETLRTTAKNDKEAQEHFLKLIENQTNKMTLLVQNILFQTQKDFYFQPSQDISINELLESVIQNFSVKAQQKQQLFNISFAKKTEKIHGDYAPLFNVFQNILDNALKYAPSKTTISIKTFFSQKQRRKLFCISIHNTGTFIPKSEYKIIFEILEIG